MLVLKCLYIHAKSHFMSFLLTEVYLNLNLFVVLCLVVIYKFVKIFQNLDVALFTHAPFTTCVQSQIIAWLLYFFFGAKNHSCYNFIMFSYLFQYTYHSENLFFVRDDHRRAYSCHLLMPG